MKVNKENYVKLLHEAYQHGEPVVPILEGPAPFRKVALGGTFDHLHAAHRLMITVAAVAASEEVIIGITTPQMTGHKQLADLIQPLEIRKEAIRSFVQVFKPTFTIITLQDPYGPTITDPTIEALVVSAETKASGEKINEIRRSKGMDPLSLITIDNLYLPDGQLLSSTLIRRQLRENL